MLRAATGSGTAASLEDARRRLLAGVPVSERVVGAGGCRTALLEGGEGPPLVLLHGGIECGGVYWGRILPALTAERRVVAPDLPGLGESHPLDRLDRAAFARWLRELIESTCDEPPALVAHSLVGTLAARAAAADSGLLSRLVVYAAPGIGAYRMPLGLRLAAIRFALRPSEQSMERFQRIALLDRDRTRAAAPEWFDAFGSYTRARARVPHVKRTMRTLVAAGTRQVPSDELGRIELPTALMWGRHDRMTPLTLAEQASARLGWPLHVIEDAAHVPHVEQPAAFAAALERAAPTAPAARGAGGRA